MKSGLLVENYSSLSKVLLNRFTLFVESPYFNKSNSVKKMHYYLLKQYPLFDEKKCSKKVVYKSVFMNDNFKLQKLKDTNSILLELFEQFLVNEALKKDKAAYRRLEIQECFDNKLKRMIKKTINTSFKEIDKLEISQIKQYYHSYILNDLMYSYQLHYGTIKLSTKYIQNSINDLDKFYLAEKMLTGATIINRQTIIKADFDLKFFKEINELIKKNYDRFKNEDIILINQQLYLIQLNNNDENYFNFKEKISKINLNKTELRVYYSFLNNFCIRMINSGKQEYNRELFDLNILKINDDLLLENKFLSERNYKNIIAIALRLKEFIWVEKFINDYSKNLPVKKFENAYNYNLANVSYSLKEYDKALNLLLDIEYTDVFYLLTSKALLLKIYYETKDYDSLDYLLHSFRLLIMRQQKISLKQKNAYYNLIKLTAAILKLKMKTITLSSQKRRTEIQSISNRMEKMESIANKTWLLEIINELQK